MDKLSYSVAGLSEATEISTDEIRRAIKRGDLIPSYIGTKPFVTRTEAERWLSTLPSEPVRRAS